MHLYFRGLMIFKQIDQKNKNKLFRDIFDNLRTTTKGIK